MAKILVIEDDKYVMELIAFLLEQVGHNVESVRDGEEGIRRARVFKPDLILLDIMMPGLDGYTAMNILAEDETTHSIPVMVVSCKGALKDLFDNLPNFVGFVKKPFEKDALVGDVNRAVHNPTLLPAAI